MAFLLHPPNPPSPPDFHLCSPFYGTTISLASCLPLLNALPSSAVVYPYRTRPPVPFFNVPPPISIQADPYTLPYTAVSGNCRLSIEIGGREGAPVVLLVPDEIRRLVEFMLWKCIWNNMGTGGFGTMNFGALLSWASGPNRGTAGRDRTPFAGGLPSFITVTISGPSRPPLSPGSTDPIIPFLLTRKLGLAATKAPHGTSEQFGLMADAAFWQTAGEGMTIGGSTPWWQYGDGNVRRKEEMGYECDIGLGSPEGDDCWHIELGPASGRPQTDLVNVGPGNTQFLGYKTCVVAVSASISISIAWEAIRAALTVLQDLCIGVGLDQAQGGRAFYRAPSPAGKVGKKRDSQAPSGLNALPPHVNVTMFRQQENWVNPSVERNSCTWKAVEGGKDVGGCR